MLTVAYYFTTCIFAHSSVVIYYNLNTVYYTVSKKTTEPKIAKCPLTLKSQPKLVTSKVQDFKWNLCTTNKAEQSCHICFVYLIKLITNTKSTSEILKHQRAIFFKFEVVRNMRPSYSHNWQVSRWMTNYTAICSTCSGQTSIILANNNQYLNHMYNIHMNTQSAIWQQC